MTGLSYMKKICIHYCIDRFFKEYQRWTKSSLPWISAAPEEQRCYLWDIRSAVKAKDLATSTLPVYWSPGLKDPISKKEGPTTRIPHMYWKGIPFVNCPIEKVVSELMRQNMANYKMSTSASTRAPEQENEGFEQPAEYLP